MANVLDKAIAAVAPRYAVKRAAARSALNIINSGYGNYGANHRKRSMRGWNYYGGSSKEDIEDNLDTLRQRSRDAYMGIPMATGAVKTLRTNVVCSGLVPTPQVDADFLKLSEEQAENLQAQIIREFNLWADSPMCDADQTDDFWKLQMLAFEGYLMNGDSFAIMPYSKPKSWQPYGLKIRLIEADRVCSPNGDDVLFPRTVQGVSVHQIVQGVETDESGAVVAYWICNRHPLAADYNAPAEWTRVEAYGAATGRRNVLHVMQRERAGQRRGVPLLAPVLESLKQIGRYTEAELDAAMIAAMVTVMIERDSPTSSPPFAEEPDRTENPDGPDDDYGIALAPAAIFDLREGEKAHMLDPKHPTTTFDGFVAAMTKQIGAALEIPPEVLYKSFSSNYSASRGALNEFWRTCGMMRDSFASDFCQPIYEQWFTEAVVRGRIAAPGFFDDPAIAKAYMNCVWNGPARTSLDAKKEVEAAILRVDSAFSTAQQETAQLTGGDYRANVRQRKSEKKKLMEVNGDDKQHEFHDDPERDQ